MADFKWTGGSMEAAIDQVVFPQVRDNVAARLRAVRCPEHRWTHVGDGQRPQHRLAGLGGPGMLLETGRGSQAGRVASARGEAGAWRARC